MKSHQFLYRIKNKIFEFWEDEERVNVIKEEILARKRWNLIKLLVLAVIIIIYLIWGRCVLKDLQGAAKSGVLQCLSTVEIKSCHLEIYRLTRDTI